MPCLFSRRPAARPLARACIAVALGLFSASCASGTKSPTAPTTTPTEITIALGVMPATTTYLSYISDVGDYIGQGVTAHYGYADGAWTAQADGDSSGVNHILVQFHSPGFVAWWFLELQAQGSGKLRVGSYEDTRRSPFQGPLHPGLDFAATGRGCNASVGRFVIKELVLGPGRRLDRLQVTFTQHCEYAVPALNGELAIVANPWQ